jgi:hypothetical protein
MLIEIVVDITDMKKGARSWWDSLTPQQRGAYVQILWEREGEPAPWRVSEDSTNTTQSETKQSRSRF